MRVLVFGKTGQVARALEGLTRREGINAVFLDRNAADFEHPQSCAGIVDAADVDVIINATGYTNVDGAEDDKDRAFLVNAATPKAIAIAAAKRDIPFLHISTDYVFEGSGDKAWREADETLPQNVYGQTKLDGERAIAAAGGAYIILRTSWVFSANGSNFVKSMLRLSETKSALSVVGDQRGGPTPALDIAKTLLKLAKFFCVGNGTSGIFHYCGQPEVSWAEFAQKIFSLAERPVRISAISSSEFPTRARRPLNSALECSKIYDQYNIKQPDWVAGLSSVLDDLKAKI